MFFFRLKGFLLRFFLRYFLMLILHSIGLFFFSKLAFFSLINPAFSKLLILFDSGFFVLHRKRREAKLRLSVQCW